MFVAALGTAILMSANCASAASNEAALLIEADTGKVLFAEYASVPWYPASVTKVMTTYVTLQAVRNKRITLDSLFTVSSRAALQAPSKMGFKPGSTVTVDNALKMLMVKSANDMAVVLAEGVSGSVEGFSAEMMQVSRRLGMTQSNWVNPNGLPADEQISSARDLAILARALIHDFPEYELYWNLHAIQMGKKVMRNYNTLLGRYEGADGMKTGFICASGFNLVASATRNGKKLIAVVLGAKSGPYRGAKPRVCSSGASTAARCRGSRRRSARWSNCSRSMLPRRICATKCAVRTASVQPQKPRTTRRARPSRFRACRQA